MDTQAIINLLDEEISKLTSARSLLSQNANTNGAATTKRPYNRKSTGVTIKASASPASKRAMLSPEARARIAAAMKKRWADKKAATKAVKSTKPAKAVAVK